MCLKYGGRIRVFDFDQAFEGPSELRFALDQRAHALQTLEWLQRDASPYPGNLVTSWLLGPGGPSPGPFLERSISSASCGRRFWILLFNPGFQRPRAIERPHDINGIT